MTVQLKDLPPQLLGLLERVRNGEEVIINDDEQPVAKLTIIQTKRRLGGEENVIRMLKGFDDRLTDFADYQ
jgi:antitoxin (DNA-binding transcriptional repressor) of toxin-antitoxin stability system